MEEYESSSDDNSSIYLGGTKVFSKRKEKTGMKKRSINYNEVMVAMKKNIILMAYTLILVGNQTGIK